MTELNYQQLIRTALVQEAEHVEDTANAWLEYLSVQKVTTTIHTPNTLLVQISNYARRNSVSPEESLGLIGLLNAVTQTTTDQHPKVDVRLNVGRLLDFITDEDVTLLSKHRGGNLRIAVDSNNPNKIQSLAILTGCVDVNTIVALPNHQFKEVHIGRDAHNSRFHCALGGACVGDVTTPTWVCLGINSSASSFHYEDLGGYKIINERYLDDLITRTDLTRFLRTL